MILLFLRLHPSTAFWTLVDCEGYSSSSKWFLCTVVGIIVIWIIFTHSSPFEFTDSLNVDVHSCHLLFDHFQFALIHGPTIPGSYAVLFFNASDLTSTTRHIHTGWCFCFGSACLFLMKFFLCSSAVAYLVPTDLGSSSFSVRSFCLFILFKGFSRQEYWSVFLFPSLVDHILLKLSTMIHMCWVVLHSIAHSFIELDKVVIHVISLVSFVWYNCIWYCILNFFFW